MTTNNTQADALVEHFPSGLRSVRHVLTATGEIFESPVRCECYCGASLVGTDEQEVRHLWAEHILAALRQTPAGEGEGNDRDDLDDLDDDDLQSWLESR